MNVMSNVELILGMPYILPLLECVHMLIKVAKNRNVFVKSVKLTQPKFYKLYCDLYIFFNDLAFDDFNAIETLTNDALPISQISNFNGGKDVVFLAFSFTRHTLYTNMTYLVQKNLACHEGIFQVGCGQKKGQLKDLVMSLSSAS
jgi:hypothetical protein